MDEKKVINHLFHEHPLILRNVIEMMIGGESVDCYACGKGINIKECAEKVYVCSMHFESDDDHCSINNFILHKKCGELPDETRHPIHPHHPLHLFDFRSLREHWCDVCRRDIGMVLGYRCSSCEFDLDITCERIGIDTLMEEKKHELHHPSHPDHPLTLMRKPAFPFYCDGCGEVDVDMAYICRTCEFWVHKKCASLPLIHQYPYHHHPLSLAFSFANEHYFKYLYRCEVCDKSFDTTCWVYICGDCRYFVHLKCVGSAPMRNSILNRSAVIQLPLHVNDIYKELITPFVMNMMREEGVIMPAAATSTTVTFFDHKKHPLSLVSVWREAREDDDDDDDDDELKKKMVMICSVCVTPISSPPYYQCTVPNCTPYFIHSICYSLPDTLQYSSSSYPQSDESHHLLQLYGHYNKIHNHQNHKFKLHSQLETNDKDAVLRKCNICGLLTNGMWYECEECDVKIDVKCASLPTTIRHAFHPHHKPLILTRIPPHQEELRCRACRHTLKQDMISDIAYFCSSDDCDFALHLRCAQLPLSIREHEWNMNCNHPLLLTFDASLDHPSDFFCEFCEREMNPNGWMYHCRQCDISVHLYGCLNSASGWYRNIKFGRRFEMDGIHPHPLTFNHITLQKRCHLCPKNVYSLTGFECASCYYVVCIECGRQQLLNI